MTTDSSTYNGPTVGSTVFTGDGDKLGTVKAVGSQMFEVNAAMQPDYWLPLSAIGTIGADGVHLGFTKDKVGEFKQSKPSVV